VSGPPPSAATGIALRELDARDADALARFLVRNDVPAVTSTFTPFPMTAATAGTLLTGRREDRFYGAFRPEGELVAFSMLRGWDEGFAVPSFGIVVDAGLHGQGLGSRLTRWTIERARELGSAQVRLSVYTDNPVAHGIYRRLGFEEVERGPGPGDGRERVVMILELAPA
jgi:ribosomal protein S18 acetylase RimI-like enzyme